MMANQHGRRQNDEDYIHNQETSSKILPKMWI